MTRNKSRSSVVILRNARNNLSLSLSLSLCAKIETILLSLVRGNQINPFRRENRRLVDAIDRYEE